MCSCGNLQPTKTLLFTLPFQRTLRSVEGGHLVLAGASYAEASDGPVMNVKQVDLHLPQYRGRVSRKTNLLFQGTCFLICHCQARQIVSLVVVSILKACHHWVHAVAPLVCMPA